MSVGRKVVTPVANIAAERLVESLGSQAARIEIDAAKPFT